MLSDMLAHGEGKNGGLGLGEGLAGVGDVIEKEQAVEGLRRLI